MYDPVMVQPMRDELTSADIKELYTAEEVETILDNENETTLIFINSVCGCAAGQARPGLLASLENSILPKNICTVFAGMEKEAVDAAREYFTGYPPSSPCLGVFRDGELVHFLQRTDFLNQSAEALGAVLKEVYNKFCGENIDENIKIPSGQEADNLEITPEKVKELLDSSKEFKFLDVRDEQELQIASIDGATQLTQDLAQEIVTTCSSDTLMVFTCHHGNRSLQAAKYFKSQGFSNVKSMSGGIEAWSDKINSSVPKY